MVLPLTAPFTFLLCGRGIGSCTPGRSFREGCVYGDQLCLHPTQCDWLVAVIRNDEKNRQVAVAAEVRIKDLGFVGHVIGVDRHRHFFSWMVIVRGIISGRLCGGHDEIFAGHGG